MNTSLGRTPSVGVMMAAALVFGVACLGGDGALGSDGIAVKITNDTSVDVVVTVIDMNANPERTLLSNETIYGFASLPIRVSPDTSGYGHIRWTATSGSAGSRSCGHNETDRLSADSNVHVSANNSCNMS